MESPPAAGVRRVAGAHPFRIELSGRRWGRVPGRALVERTLERLLHFPELGRIYEAVVAIDDQRHFVDRALDVLGVRWKVDDRDLAQIPAAGPLVVVANHPFGAVEGLVLAAMLRRVRSDVKVLANHLLSRLAELDDVMIYVDPFSGPAAVRRNHSALRQALTHLKSGGLLAVFPAGEVAHLHLQQRAVLDAPWSSNVARLVRRARAPVVPVYFEGANGAVFQLAGLVHPRLRTAMLPRELLNKRQRVLRLRVGGLAPFARLGRFADDQELTSYLRLRTFILHSRRGDDPGGDSTHAARAGARTLATLAEPVDVELLERDLSRLPADALLLEPVDVRVYCAAAHELPNILAEIGRLREVTFRLAGEGSGRTVDLDRFDEHYLHLFIWNLPQRQIVGAYRLGATDTILPEQGVAGLYTSALFGYQQSLVEQLHPALEMGRAFVRPEHQKSYAPLMLLWKGIGAYLVRHPHYRTLFGPVSITNQYHSTSRQLMIEFLRANRMDADLAKMLNPPNPPRVTRRPHPELAASSKVVRDIEEVSALVGEIERDHKGVPILLRQYLKLSARLLGFNVDPAFGDVTDALVVVPVSQIPRHILAKYLGDEGSASYLRHQLGA